MIEILIYLFEVVLKKDDKFILSKVMFHSFMYFVK